MGSWKSGKWFIELLKENIKQQQMAIGTM